jgi:hypothetical protein
MTDEIRKVTVTVEQVIAARVRVAGDEALERETPAWIVKLAKTPLPQGGSAGRGGPRRDPERRQEPVGGRRR